MDFFTIYLLIGLVMYPILLADVYYFGKGYLTLGDIVVAFGLSITLWPIATVWSLVEYAKDINFNKVIIKRKKNK